MREIKFRAWHKGFKRMYYPMKYVYEIKGTGKKQADLDMVVFLGKKWGIDRAGEELVGEKSGVLMQFTGLKDKNGKEIYEGDILRRRSSQENTWGKLVNWIVTWQFKEFSLRADYLYERANETDYLYQNFDGGTGVVIGNIYENKDLLK